MLVVGIEAVRWAGRGECSVRPSQECTGEPSGGCSEQPQEPWVEAAVAGERVGVAWAAAAISAGWFFCPQRHSED